ncbi:type II toxin-antitoxin system PemK/MazF family toxin [Streptomyces bacillaris]|uniref:type II toxin-antitoxin system PemK/MazF family toxin n=1 Tax=Streptomyces bacillaris TaxID=68179 RepID=UPI00362E5B55
MAEILPVRGRVYMADLEGDGPKPWLVVSRAVRNQKLRDVLVVRITTSKKPDLETIVELGPHDPLVGRVLCDDIGPLYRDEIKVDVGALSPATMAKVAAALRVSLALD